MLAADQQTIQEQGITSWDQMEKASSGIFAWIKKNLPNDNPYHIYAGVGNNGGDGLALARMLSQAGKKVKVTLVPFSEIHSEDFTKNSSNNSILWKSPPCPNLKPLRIFYKPMTNTSNPSRVSPPKVLRTSSLTNTTATSLLLLMLFLALGSPEECLLGYNAYLRKSIDKKDLSLV